MQSNPERHASGTLTVNIWCSETGEPPENLEPEVRAAICDVFLQPDAAPPFSLSWERSDAFQAQRSDEMLVNGITVLFDLFAFPSHETTDPDPVLAINEYAKKWAPEALVIGRDTLAPFTFATEQQPIFYFRLSALSLYRETNTVAWLNGVLTGHIFAPETTRMKWLKALVDSLALDGEVIMLDKSPMFLTNIKADSSARRWQQGSSSCRCGLGCYAGSPTHTPYAHLPPVRKEGQHGPENHREAGGRRGGLLCPGADRRRRSKFGVSPDIMAAALKTAGLTRATKAKAKKLAEDFAKKEVK